MMADVFRVASMQKICQVDIAESYDHKHQSLSEGDPDAGLNKMACDVALCLLRAGTSGIVSKNPNQFTGLVENFIQAARGLLRFYRADARINTLQFDGELEARTIQLFAASLERAISIHQAYPDKPAGAPSSQQTEAKLPGFGVALAQAAKDDARE
jgi:glucosyl-3-phosphoglycerate synthase